METPARTILKTLTWQTSGLITMTVIGYVATGSLSAGGAMALASTALGTVAYILHERAWARVAWGRRPYGG